MFIPSSNGGVLHIVLSFTGDKLFGDFVRLFLAKSFKPGSRQITCLIKPERSRVELALISYSASVVQKQLIDEFHKYVDDHLSEFRNHMDSFIVVLPKGRSVFEPEETRRIVQNEVLLVEVLSDQKTRLILRREASIALNWSMEGTSHEFEIFPSAVNVPGGDVLVMNNIILTGRHRKEDFKTLGESVADYSILSLKQETNYGKKDLGHSYKSWIRLYGWDESGKLVAPLYDLDLYLCVLERTEKVVFFVGELMFDESFYKSSIAKETEWGWKIISGMLDTLSNTLISIEDRLGKPITIKRLPILLGGNTDNCVSYCNGVIDDNGKAGRFMVAAPKFSEHSMLSEKSILEANSRCDAAFEGLNVKVSRMNVSADDVKLEFGGLNCRSKVVRRFLAERTSSTS